MSRPPEIPSARRPWRALVLGGARSGKSAYAERLARARAADGRALVYVATAEALDAEMAQRIARHQADRGPGWRTLERPRALPEALAAARADEVTLVDCLTLWLTNEMLAAGAETADAEMADAEMAARRAELAAAARAAEGDVIFVSNEIGLGLVPETALGRRFRDAQGRLNQDIAAISEYVAFCAAGLPLALKGAAPGAGDGDGGRG